MNFGKVTHPSQLNSPIPRITTQHSPAPPQQASAPATPRIFVGAPVWGKKEWIGQLYPPKTSPKDFLKFYALQMNSIELNTTFYRIPEPTTVLNWKQSVPADFRFCPKVFQGISQFTQLAEIPKLLNQFCEAVQLFDQNLGTCFLQLPPYFGPERILILKRFFKLLPARFPLAIEFRHPDWFQDHRLIEGAFQLLSEHSISPVITDALGRADVLHGSLTTSRVLIRFLGNSLHPSDFTRIEYWVTRLGEWLAAGIHEVYFFMHQPEEAGAIELVQFFVDRLNQAYGKSHGIHLQGIELSRAQPQIELF